ncbi:S1 family peptidase [Leisingera sp. JC1]|uniref:S1 family peptidase n=1 Tax=Leisingera sp. JC1 TaxID=1855282 RepID=UPI0011323AB8|nr:S1 family peptidase [Leisingera sp. JC1]
MSEKTSLVGKAIIIFSCLSVGYGNLSAEEGEQSVLVEALEQDVEMKFLDPREQDGIDVEQRVKGAVGVLSAKNFPGVLKFFSHGKRKCTAVLVGPQALLTAAHCLGSKKYSVRVNGDNISMKCYHHSAYNSGPEHANDWALCRLAKKVTEVSVFETVDVENRPMPGQVPMLTGYGCTRTGGPSSNILLYGYAEVVKRPAVVPVEKTAFFTKASLQDPATGALLCSGDSGGPVFMTGTGGPTDRPLIVGVNSRTHDTLRLSWFSATASNTGLELFRAFVTELDTPVCGLEYKGVVYRKDCR